MDDEGPETFNPWSIVHLVFEHLSDQGLHPTLGEGGDPAEHAAGLLRALGDRAGRGGQPRGRAGGARPSRGDPRGDARRAVPGAFVTNRACAARLTVIRENFRR